ncbi:SUKH-4 family immunity protein [Streptomyces sp. NPDC050422]|uniref:SUKH-4 family immunity protein n=1 Tax=Streptomyces sp. NPDC050422 TaxID=3365614 RepID=UPI0037B243AE
MLDHQDLVDQWGMKRLIHFPVDRYRQLLNFDLTLLPPNGAIPTFLPSVFTVNINGPARLFNVIEMHLGAEVLRFIAIGAAPDDPDLLFCLDTNTGAVALVDINQPAIELANSSVRTFVQFLTSLQQLLKNNGKGHPIRAGEVSRLNRELRSIDSAAFADPESWWSVVFLQLAN